MHKAFSYATHYHRNAIICDNDQILFEREANNT